MSQLTGVYWLLEFSENSLHLVIYQTVHYFLTDANFSLLEVTLIKMTQLAS